MQILPCGRQGVADWSLDPAGFWKASTQLPKAVGRSDLGQGPLPLPTGAPEGRGRHASRHAKPHGHGVLRLHRTFPLLCIAVSATRRAGVEIATDCIARQLTGTGIMEQESVEACDACPATASVLWSTLIKYTQGKTYRGPEARSQSRRLCSMASGTRRFASQGQTWSAAEHTCPWRCSKISPLPALMGARVGAKLGAIARLGHDRASLGHPNTCRPPQPPFV